MNRSTPQIPLVYSESGDIGPAHLRLDLILANSSCTDPVSERGHSRDRGEDFSTGV